MAENLDMPQMGNFSIQDTMDMGMGNQELLNDLLSPDSATSNPDDIQDIKDEPAPAPTKKTTSKQTAPSTSATEEDKKDEAPEKDIQSFLYGEDDDTEEGDEEAAAPAKKAKQPADNQEDSNEEDGDEEADAPESTFSSLSKDLFKLGVFTQGEDDEEEPITTAEEFLERFNAEKKKGAIEVVDNFIGQFGEDYQKAFDAIFVKGVNPKDYFSAFNQIQSFSEMDLSDESNQVAVIKQALTDQGFDPEDVTTEVERLKNYGDLETVAAKHHKVLIKKEASKLQQLEQDKQAQLQQQQAIKQQYLQNVNNVLQDKIKAKEFDGIPINPKLAGELQDFLVTDKYKTASGETLTDFDRTILELKRPENHEKKVKLALLMKIIEKDPTLSTIQKTGITKKSNELFGEVARQAQKSSVKSKQSARPTSSWFQ
jgi:DNA-binding transcriptional MerR regulator